MSVDKRKRTDEAVVVFVGRYVRERGIGPTYLEISASTGLRSKASVHRAVKRLALAGRLRHLPSRRRAVAANPQFFLFNRITKQLVEWRRR
jgi:SOS-response transcriptional repressor LexA